RLPAPMWPPIKLADVEAAPLSLDEPDVELVAEPELEPELVPAADSGNEIVLQVPSVSERFHTAQTSGLAIYCFGNFRVYCNDVRIDRWESARGRTILKYLVARRATAIPKELLADMFWPDSEPELARRSLHQAIYCLRQTFKRVAPNMQIIRFSNDRYQLNLDMPIWVDSEAFSQEIEQARAHYAAGKIETPMQAYPVAIDLYHAPFLAEDRYEEWTDE